MILIATGRGCSGRKVGAPAAISLLRRFVVKSVPSRPAVQQSAGGHLGVVTLRQSRMANSYPEVAHPHFPLTYFGSPAHTCTHWPRFGS